MSDVPFLEQLKAKSEALALGLPTSDTPEARYRDLRQIYLERVSTVSFPDVRAALSSLQQHAIRDCAQEQESQERIEAVMVEVFKLDAIVREHEAAIAEAMARVQEIFRPLAIGYLNKILAGEP